MPVFSEFLIEQKQRMRDEMRAKRLALANENPNAASQLDRVFLDNVQLEPNAVIAGYHAFRGEMALSGLIKVLRHRGHQIVLPVVNGKQSPLTFRLWKPHDKLVTNSMGILEPDSATPELDPTILLVPMLAFDRARNRLGYGGGFYDRTITALRKAALEKGTSMRAIGIGYSFQELSEIPTDIHDRKMDMIVTECGVC